MAIRVPWRLVTAHVKSFETLMTTRCGVDLPTIVALFYDASPTEKLDVRPDMVWSLCKSVADLIRPFVRQYQTVSNLLASSPVFRPHVTPGLFQITKSPDITELITNLPVYTIQLQDDKILQNLCQIYRMLQDFSDRG
eukprot:gene19487-6698_t